MTQDTSQFARYATGAAFRIDLTRHMIVGLMRAASGEEMTSAHHGANGLVNRGLLEPKEIQPRSWARNLQITDAGRKVAELCEMAGLGEIKEGG